MRGFHRDVPGAKYSLECECGQPKERGVIGCPRCRRLATEFCSADTRRRAVVVGYRARVHDGSKATGRAFTAFLQERGLIDDERWRNTNGAIGKGGGQ